MALYFFFQPHLFQYYYHPLDEQGALYRQTITMYADNDLTAAVKEDAILTGPAYRLLQNRI